MYRCAMDDKRISPPRPGAADARAERLAVALRANLRRRKQQARGRAESETNSAAAAKPVREPAK
jgi:hypothetical protein